jgi:hypothetical protein
LLTSREASQVSVIFRAQQDRSGENPVHCSRRIKLWTQNHLFTCKTGFFGRNKVADWTISHP